MRFKIDDFVKLTDHVSSVQLERRESEYVSKRALLWFDIPKVQCFIKRFSINDTLKNEHKEMKNADIEIDNEGSKQVRIICDFERPEVFSNYGKIDLNKIHALFETFQISWSQAAAARPKCHKNKNFFAYFTWFEN